MQKETVLCLFIFACTHLSLKVYASYTNSLKDISFYQGALSEQLIFHFDTLPTCISQPVKTSTKYADSHGRKKAKRQVTFSIMLPKTYIKYQRISRMLETINQTYKNMSVTLASSNKPIHSLYITISYNPLHIGCEYGHAMHGENSYLIAFYHKQAYLKDVDNKKEKIKHQKKQNKKKYRILLNTAQLTNISDRLHYIVKKIGNFLKQKDIEVIYTNKNSYEHVVSYANCVLKPDFSLTLCHDAHRQASEPFKVWHNHQKIFFTRPKHLSTYMQQYIKQFHQTCFDMHKQCAYNLTKELASVHMLTYAPCPALSKQPPYGFEAPALTIACNTNALTKHQINQFAHACAIAVQNTRLYNNS